MEKVTITPLKELSTEMASLRMQLLMRWDADYIEYFEQIDADMATLLRKILELETKLRSHHA